VLACAFSFNPVSILTSSSLLSVSPHCASLHISSPSPLVSNHFLLSSLLFYPSSYHRLFSLPRFLSVFLLWHHFSDKVIAMCWQSSRMLLLLFQRSLHHTTPFCLLTHTQTLTQSAPPDPTGYGQINKPFCGSYGDAHKPFSLGSMLYLLSCLTQTNEHCSKSDYLLSSHCTGRAVIKSQGEWHKRSNEECKGRCTQIMHTITLLFTSLYLLCLLGSGDKFPFS